MTPQRKGHDASHRGANIVDFAGSAGVIVAVTNNAQASKAQQFLRNSFLIKQHINGSNKVESN